MKKLILSFGAALALVACNEVPEQTAGAATQQQVQQPIPDTAGLASFREWKVQNELADVSEYQAQQPVASAPIARKTVKKTVAAPARKSTPASQPTEQPAASTPDNTVSTGDGGNSGSGTSNSGTTETAKTEKKEGWSKAAKGAVIGGVAGAAGGAVVNKKNRVVGAVVGAVIGAGGGYAIGRGMDKKDGRIEYAQ
jgi:Glycine zipper